MGVLAYNLLHMLRQFYLMGEEIIQLLGDLFGRLFCSGNIDADLDFPTTSLSINDAYKVQDKP
jgi:hypothetical protein